MRDPNRIDPFMAELGMIWKKNCPDWRFGQLMFNATRVLKTSGIDIFYMEDDKLLEYFREWFDTTEEDERIRKYMENEKMLERDVIEEIMKTKRYKEE